MRSFLIWLLFFGASFVHAQKINTTLTYSLQKPAVVNGKNPVLIMLHGYGSNEADLFDMSALFGPDVITFSLRAPLSAGNGGFCWFPIEFDNKGIKKYNYADALKSRLQVTNFIREACKVFHLDSAKVFLMGFSQGAIMSYDLLLTSPSLVKGIMALSGRILVEDQKLLPDRKKTADSRIFIGHGDSDNVIPVSESVHAESHLKKTGFRNITFRRYEMPHSINGAELNDLKSWFAQQQKQ